MKIKGESLKSRANKKRKVEDENAPGSDSDANSNPSDSEDSDSASASQLSTSRNNDSYLLATPPADSLSATLPARNPSPRLLRRRLRLRL